MEQWIARRTVVPFVVQLLGLNPLQNIRSPKTPYMIDWLIDCLISYQYAPVEMAEERRRYEEEDEGSHQLQRPLVSSQM